MYSSSQAMLVLCSSCFLLLSALGWYWYEYKGGDSYVLSLLNDLKGGSSDKDSGGGNGGGGNGSDSNTQGKGGELKSDASVSDSPPSGKSLPIPTTSKGGQWNVDWSNSLKSGSSGLVVTYERGKHGGGSGTQFRANPFGMFPATKAGIGCSVFVPKDFEFTKGKLGPGFCIGPKCSTDHSWTDESGSARMSFEEHGAVLTYLYIPTQANPKHESGSGGLKPVVGGVLKKGAWNDIALYVDLGTPGKADGKVAIWLNGRRWSATLMWRKDSSVLITKVLFASFFGGGKNAAPSQTQSLTFKNFYVFDSM